MNVHRSSHGDVVCSVVQAFFISAEEDAFLDEHGPDAFEERFRQQFGTALTIDERVELAVDKSKAQQVEASCKSCGKNRTRVERSAGRPACRVRAPTLLQVAIDDAEQMVHIDRLVRYSRARWEQAFDLIGAWRRR